MTRPPASFPFVYYVICRICRITVLHATKILPLLASQDLGYLRQEKFFRIAVILEEEQRKDMEIKPLLKPCILLALLSLTSCASLAPQQAAETPVIKVEKELPSTFSVEQEKVLAKNQKVLAFLYHMTRKKLNFRQMGELYTLKSVATYRAFMIKHGLIKASSGDEVEFLFLNPYGTWALRNKNPQESPIIAETKKLGLQRLASGIAGTAINEDDTVTPVWTTNTFRLTAEEYRAYKAELLNLTSKYSKLSQGHLTNNTPHQVIWSMTMARTTTAAEAEKSHLLFGEVEEF